MDEGIHVGVEIEPVKTTAVTLGQEVVAGTQTNGVPALQIVNRCESGRIQRSRPRGRRKSIHLRPQGIKIIGGNERPCRVWLDHVPEPIQAPFWIHEIAQILGKFKRCLRACVKISSVRAINRPVNRSVTGVAKSGLRNDVNDVAQLHWHRKLLIGIETGVTRIEQLGADGIPPGITKRQGEDFFRQLALITAKLIKQRLSGGVTGGELH